MAKDNAPPSLGVGRVRDLTERVAGLGVASKRQRSLDEELRKLLWTPLSIVSDVGYFLRRAGRHDTPGRERLSRYLL